MLCAQIYPETSKQRVLINYYDPNPKKRRDGKKVNMYLLNKEEELIKRMNDPFNISLGKPKPDDSTAINCIHTVIGDIPLEDFAKSKKANINMKEAENIRRISIWKNNNDGE